MTSEIASRGPDSDGSWVDDEEGIVLGHRRLAVLDLSAAGSQPMFSASGRFVMVFNGEIYNHLVLRGELEGMRPRSWVGHSDTETLLAGFEVWGIEDTFRRAVGMFAVAIWDRSTRSLALVRDRFGEKPLYYGWQGSGANRTLIFGSQLKAMRRHPAFETKVCRSALRNYLRRSVVGGNESIYEGVRKVPPGTVLVFSGDDEVPAIQQYWSIDVVACHAMASPFAGSDHEAIEELSSVLGRAVRSQMLSDVPLGAFLSGGVDSSTIVALMQASSVSKVNTFSIGFNESEFDEAPYARSIAKHLGTDHSEYYVTASEALRVVPGLADVYDEPFADSSQIPTMLVMQLARKQVTVALSGDAGDELFGGYNRHVIAASVWQALKRIPAALRGTLAMPMRKMSPEGLDRAAKWAGLGRWWSNPGEKLGKAAIVFGSREDSELYEGLTSSWPDARDVVLGSDAPYRRTQLGAGMGPYGSAAERMMLADLSNYLPDDILTKVDRAAMAVSLETRIPLLDHRVAEFAFSLPLHMKIRREANGFVSKWILRQLLYRSVPRVLVERPKMGFGAPVGNWLRGPLRGWAEDLLEESRLRKQGYFDADCIRCLWSDHLQGRRNFQSQLWTILMFQAWLDRYGG